MTKPKAGATRGGKRAGSGRPPKDDPLAVTITVAVTHSTSEAIDADRERIKREVPEATVDRASWVRAAIIEKLSRTAFEHPTQAAKKSGRR